MGRLPKFTTVGGLCLAFLLLIALGSASGQWDAQALAVTNIQGGLDRHTIVTGEIVRIEISAYNITERGDGLVGMSNAFTISSPDGAKWGALSGAYADTIPPDAFSIDSIALYGADGAGTDTIAFWATQGTACGLPKDYIGAVYYIDIGPFGHPDHGKTIVLDSCMATPLDKWAWVVGNCDVVGPMSSPDWNGPYTISIVDTTLATAVDREDGVLPERSGLSANWPNPFNPSTQFEVRVANPGRVQLAIFDVLGRKVCTLADTEKAQGRYLFTWDGLNDHGVPVASGVYFARLVAGGVTETRKIVKLQ